MSTAQSQPISTQSQPIITENKPSGKKLRKIVKAEKDNRRKIWLIGHLVTITFGVVYAMYYFQFKAHSSNIAFLAYHISFFGVWTSYLLSIQSQYNLKSLPNYATLIGTENFQFFLLSIIWVFNRSSLFKLLPYLIISLLHLSENYKLDVILKLENIFAAIIMYNEIFLFVSLLVDTVLVRGSSGYGLVVYAMFLWLRILQNENTRYFLYAQLIRFDNIMLKIKNPKVASVWRKIKKFLSYKQANFEQKFL